MVTTLNQQLIAIIIAHSIIERTAKGIVLKGQQLLLMVDKKINFTLLFILVVNQIHNLHKQSKLYIFQAPFDSLYKLCKHSIFFFLFLILQSFEGFPQRIPLSDVLTLIIFQQLDQPLVPTLNRYNHFKFNSEVQGNFCTNNFKEILETEVTI